ncbi:MAG TPA: sigma-54 dependent transcriptional regulator [Thauera sp.]|uniref:sigma-54-dependent transcriptional regulator n=1 Tax=Thauera sp. TaxID=1905334 RepID=UPI002CEBCE95|nr:sigma-54 dependent transcriptional regulator [Thauera sp.]HRP23781.1 sigma-54 dependent transcriptional regulator [Thauera sp.]HRP64562.1 sigma-54 dependent transcriptional regulator [Thauera sp.]
MLHETAVTLDKPVDLAEYNWQAHSVLVVDDEEGMRHFLERTLARRCGMVQAVADAEHAAALMARLHFDLLILDIALPGKSGIEWLHELREHGYTGDVILVTAFADMETAIDALRGGASDFILKPFRVDQILNSIKRCFERARLARENFVLKRELAGLAADPIGLVGHSPAIEQLRGLIRRVGQMPSTVLLLGESGTGKEVVARALHHTSPRAQRPFVPVNCAAIASELIESELFGHVKGAFTGASESRNGLFYYAHGGTLFLDEISELPLAMQTRLLRVLEERKVRPVGSERELPVDVRIIAASNRDLAAEVQAGRFRQDLYYRLAVVDIAMPPLRGRAEDIPDLMRHFMQHLAVQLGVAPLPLSHEVVTRLQAYPWPGNVRELRNFVERSMILGSFATEAFATPVASLPPPAGELELTLAEVERRHIERVTDACAGNKSEAARRLGVSRKTLERKFAEWSEAVRHEDGEGRRARMQGMERRA